MRDLVSLLSRFLPFGAALRPVLGGVYPSRTRCEYIPVRSRVRVPRLTVLEGYTPPKTSARCRHSKANPTQGRSGGKCELRSTEGQRGRDLSKTVERGIRGCEPTGMYSRRVLERSLPRWPGPSAAKKLISSLTAVLLTLFCLSAQADDPKVTVANTFIDVHTGPGRGYPVFYIIEKDEEITLEKRRTDWIKVTTRRGKSGWIHIDNLAHTQDASGQVPDIAAATQDDYLERRWEIGFATGDFDGADALSLNAGFRFTEHLTADLRLSQNTGQFSDSQILSVGLMHQPFPEWRVSPYFRLGTGQIRIEPSATLVEAEDREDNLFQTSLGTYVYLTRRFFLRLDATQHQILTSRDTNEEVIEWQIGFNVYF